MILSTLGCSVQHLLVIFILMFPTRLKANMNYYKTAVVAEKDALQQQNAVLKVKEAKAAANKSEDLAVRMRQKAQQLMENADLATYKAMMALKIAEAAKIAKSTKAVAPFFLG